MERNSRFRIPSIIGLGLIITFLALHPLSHLPPRRRVMYIFHPGGPFDSDSFFSLEKLMPPPQIPIFYCNFPRAKHHKWDVLEKKVTKQPSAIQSQITSQLETLAKTGSRSSQRQDKQFNNLIKKSSVVYSQFGSCFSLYFIASRCFGCLFGLAKKFSSVFGDICILDYGLYSNETLYWLDSILEKFKGSRLCNILLQSGKN